MTPRQYAVSLRRQAETLRQGKVEVLQATATDLQDTARRLSSGPLGPVTQQRDGPFYSRALGAKADPNVLNVWEGRFREGWDTDAGEDGVSLFQTDYRAEAFARGEVAGEPLMVERHPEEAAQADVALRHQQRVEALFRKVTR